MRPPAAKNPRETTRSRSIGQRQFGGSALAPAVLAFTTSTTAEAPSPRALTCPPTARPPPSDVHPAQATATPRCARHRATAAATSSCTRSMLTAVAARSPLEAAVTTSAAGRRGSCHEQPRHVGRAGVRRHEGAGHRGPVALHLRAQSEGVEPAVQQPVVRDQARLDDERLARHHRARPQAHPGSRSSVTSRAATRRRRRDARAASCSASSSSGVGLLVPEQHHVVGPLPPEQRVVHGQGPVARMPTAGPAPPSRGSTGSAARRGPTARPGPPPRAARRPCRWSQQPAGVDGAPVLPRDAEAVDVASRPRRRAPGRSRRRTGPTSARPAASSSTGGYALAAEVVVHTGRRCVTRGAPRRSRARTPRPGQGERPAQPGGPTADHHYVQGRVHRRPVPISARLNRRAHVAPVTPRRPRAPGPGRADV